MPGPRLPVALARLHADLPVGAVVEISVGELPVRHLVASAGFGLESLTDHEGHQRAQLIRQRTLPDVVGPGMRLLVCGLNPSLYAADAGVNFARPGNRFWPAMIAAGLVDVDRDPWRALADKGIGFTDLVKRATTSAEAVTDAEYRDGLPRLEWLVSWLRPRTICFVGLAGWRAVADRHAVAGLQPGTFAGVPAYVMPSTSGRNARSSLTLLTAHLSDAASLAPRNGALRRTKATGPNPTQR